MQQSRQSSVAAFLVLALGAQLTSGQEKQPSKEDGIVSMVQSYVDAFNKRDAERVSKHWATNGELLDSSGKLVVGRENIRKAMEQQFREMDEDQVLSVTVNKITFVTKEVAIESGIADVGGSRSNYTAVHKFEDRMWRLHSIQESPMETETRPANKLDELAWMVGEWVDQSDDAVVRTSCRWSNNENFLVINFRVEVPDADPLEGTQVIGYDSIKNKIRSWRFDSNGGIGEGSWTRKGNRWFVRTKSVTSDGKSATSTNIFTRKDEFEFSFKSTNRKLSGEKLPDVGPVKVVRLKEVTNN